MYLFNDIKHFKLLKMKKLASFHKIAKIVGLELEKKRVSTSKRILRRNLQNSCIHLFCHVSLTHTKETNENKILVRYLDVNLKSVKEEISKYTLHITLYRHSKHLAVTVSSSLILLTKILNACYLCIFHLGNQMSPSTKCSTTFRDTQFNRK